MAKKDSETGWNVLRNDLSRFPRLPFHLKNHLLQGLTSGTAWWVDLPSNHALAHPSCRASAWPFAVGEATALALVNVGDLAAVAARHGRSRGSRRRWCR